MLDKIRFAFKDANLIFVGNASRFVDNVVHEIKITCERNLFSRVFFLEGQEK